MCLTTYLLTRAVDVLIGNLPGLLLVVEVADAMSLGRFIVQLAIGHGPIVGVDAVPDANALRR